MSTAGIPQRSHAKRSRPSLDWHDQAVCHDEDMYPENRRDTARAKQICIGCPVMAKCLTHAMSAPEDYGIWGGLSEWERAEMQRKRLSA